LNFSFRVDLGTDPIDFPLTVSCGQSFRWQKAQNGTWTGVDGDNAYRVCVHSGYLEVESTAPRAAFDRLFRLDTNLTELKRNILGLDHRLASVVASLKGLRLMRPSDPVEVLFSFVCSANNHIPRITSMVQTLASMGPEICGGFRRFPTLKQLQQTTEEELRRKGFGYRARSCATIANHLLQQDAELSSWQSLPYDQVYDQLVALPYIGPKLADCIALYAFDKVEAVPADTHLWAAATPLYLPEAEGQAITPRRYRSLGNAMRARFGSLAGFVQQYLFVHRMMTFGSGRTMAHLR
jgi:N-glycosylase/DNA lyase